MIAFDARMLTQTVIKAEMLLRRSGKIPKKRPGRTRRKAAGTTGALVPVKRSEGAIAVKEPEAARIVRKIATGTGTRTERKRGERK